MRNSPELGHTFVACGRSLEISRADLEKYRGEPPRFVVYLVHGTWSASARWILGDSRFTQRLSARLHGPILLDRIFWSGKNSIHAREQATHRLSDELRQRIAQFPSAVHFIVAHSHGGNIALQAISGGSLSTRVGLICLSTPFLNVRRRRIPSLAETLAGMGVFILIVVASYMPMKSWSEAHHLAFWLKNNPWISWADLKADDVMSWPAVAFLLLLSFLFPQARKKAETLWEQLHYEVPADAMLKILRTRGDEASAALSAYHLMGWSITSAIAGIEAAKAAVEGSWWAGKLPRRPWVRVARWKKPSILQKICLLLMNGSILLGIVLGLSYLTRPHQRLAIGIIMGYFGALYLVPVLAGFVLGALFLFVLLPFALLGSLSFGWDALIAALIFEITAESTPEGTWDVSLLSLPKENVLQNRMMHSLLYDDDLAVDEIAAWANTLEPRQRGSVEPRAGAAAGQRRSV